MFQEGRRQVAQGRHGAHQGRIGDDADVEVHQAPGPPGLESQPDLGAFLAGVERQAAAGVRGAGEGLQDVGRDPLAAQGQGDLVAFPGQVGFRGPMLQGAAAAVAEMRAWRIDAVGAWLQNLINLEPPLADAAPHQLAGQGKGREEARRDPVTLRAHLFYSKGLRDFCGVKLHGFSS